MVNQLTLRASGPRPPGKTPVRSMRIPDEEWRYVTNEALRLGTTATNLYRAGVTLAIELRKNQLAKAK
jgi:hypothetical protein